jgi:pimeloyl-ACP methyl ester carboxylesterase
MLLAGCALAGCSSPAPITIGAKAQQVRADDKFLLTTYPLEQTNTKAPPPRAILFYVPGSSDKSVTTQIDAMAGAVTMDIEVVLTERRGVQSNSAVDLTTFHKNDNRARRIADMRSVISAYLPLVAPNLPVILMGESEGGDIAGAVAALEPRVKYLVILGSGGGWNQARELEYFVENRKDYLGIADLQQLQETFAKIKADPKGMTMWLGHTYQRWASYLWVTPANELTKLNIPIFLAQGDADESVPVQSARALRDDFQKLGKTNLTYREYHDVNHSFRDTVTHQSIRPLIELDLLKWFQRQGVINEQEVKVFSDRVHKAHPEWFGDE